MKKQKRKSSSNSQHKQAGGPGFALNCIAKVKGTSAPIPVLETASSLISKTGAARYGSKYWCVVLPYDRRRYFYADTVRIEADGVLVGYTGYPRTLAKDQVRVEYPVVAFNNHDWLWFYAANYLDGKPLVVDHRPGHRPSRIPAGLPMWRALQGAGMAPRKKKSA